MGKLHFVQMSVVVMFLTILFSCFYFASTFHGVKQMYLATVEFD